MPPRALILFDGVCHLCDGFVQFILRRDRRGVFEFAPLQSELGRKWAGESMDSVVLVEDDRIDRAEEAVIRVLKRLGGIWAVIAGLLRLIPGGLLRWGYRFVAQNRYRWFGREDVCILPRPEWKGRFLA